MLKLPNFRRYVLSIPFCNLYLYAILLNYLQVKEFAEKAVVMKPTVTKSAPKTAPVPKAVERPATNSSADPPKKKAVVKKPAGNTGTFVKKSAANPPATAVLDDLPADPVRGSPPPPTDKHGRIDISGQLTSTLIEKLSDKSWKIREDHLEKVSRLIVNKQIQANIGELPLALSQRLQDSNRNIALNAIVLCQNLAIALGPHAKQHVRYFLPSVLAGLCDNKVRKLLRTFCCEYLLILLFQI